MGRAYIYKPGAVRWRRHDGKGDVRGYKPAQGWEASAALVDRHPVTDKPLPSSQWWLKETFTGAK